MRVATYARYSSDQQREASIADQQRILREHCAREGWTVVAEFSDAAISGSTSQRPGFQALRQLARARACDLVLAEALDRLSRDQADTAKLLKDLTFLDIQLVTLAEGVVNELHVGFKGTMNAMVLKDQAQKTRRGMRGVVEAGRSGGGNSYGYDVVRVVEGQPRGDRVINELQAAIVRRIFEEFAAGVSPKAIAKSLNREAVPPPREHAWSPSTITGQVGRGTGLLNNELYVGRLVWNRLRYVKDPDTGRRLSRPNPPSAWISVDVPHLRIIDDDLWRAAKARQAVTRQATPRGAVRGQRPRHLFSGLTVCGTCGGGFTIGPKDGLICYNARERGTCTNRRRIKRGELEQRVLIAMRERLFEPGHFAEFCRSYTEELTRLRREHLAGLAGQRRRLTAAERRRAEILRALSEGYRSEAWKAELIALDAEIAELAAAVQVAEPPALHPNMAETFRQKATALAAGLERGEQPGPAREALRGFIERIVIPPDGLLRVFGNLGSMLAAAQGVPLTINDACGIGGCGGPQLSAPHVSFDLAA